MYNPLADFKNTFYSVILFLVFPICFLQAQTVFEKLPNIETLSPKALKKIQKQKKNGLVITDTPAAIFINNYRGKNDKLFHKFKKLEQEIYKFSGFDGAVVASFPMMTTSSSGVSFKSGDAEFVLDSVYMPECGVILNDGKEAPVIIRGLKDSYVPEFKAYFGVANTEAFQKLVNKFEKKADRKSNRQFKKDFKNKINDINENEGEHIPFPVEAAGETNDVIFKTLFVEENIIPDYKTLKNTKKVYIEYTAGSWKGRNYTFEYDEQQRIVAYKRRLYDNTDIDTYKVKYFADGLIKKIEYISERIDINSKSYETILIKTPDPLTLRMLQVPSKGEGAAVSIELDDLYSYDFYYDTLHQLKEMKYLYGKMVLKDTKYDYQNKNLVKKVWTAFDSNKELLMVRTENFSYNKENEMIGRDYSHEQKGIESYSGSYIVSPKGEKEPGRSMTLTYYYDKQGRKVLIKETNENFPYEIKFTYEDFDTAD
ncbi:hypothetical protein [Flavobacterium reichenbachii]|uniref:Uncharacterized protein n=1 Tax=Flavobacterium reichenbachii TaxID=362418 RepID=A0A085ZLW0_9FLAO|nr:hypothetical protein [Flavobacterium reichenbachii]KFF05424.1 hypothetical protein IW19_07765 [Flavobacterium reichenbachii]OXB12352.1 hypothetical protein B0A68_19155 [Flavobacterium reichenbachii]